jgi:hypothetical protein
MWHRHPGLIFMVLQQRDPAIIPGTALAQAPKEAPVAESFNDKAECSHDYEISVWQSSLDFDYRLDPGGRRHGLRTFLSLASCPAG